MVGIKGYDITGNNAAWLLLLWHITGDLIGLDSRSEKKFTIYAPGFYFNQPDISFRFVKIIRDLQLFCPRRLEVDAQDVIY